MKSIKNSLLFLLLTSATTCRNNNLHTVFVPGFVDPDSMYVAHQQAFPNQRKHDKVRFFDEENPNNFFYRCIFSICNRLGLQNLNYESYMGQEDDVRRLKNHINSINQKMVIFARSKGAAATINTLAEQTNPNIQAIILDSPPSDLVKAVHSRLAPLGLSLSCNEFLWRFNFPNYPKNAIPPIDQIKNIANKDLPILIIASKTDLTIPFTQALQLYLEFKKHSFSHVHLAIVNAPHCRGITKDKERYLQCIHSFYKHYQLQHNPAYATQSMQQYSYNVSQAQAEIAAFNDDINHQIRHGRIMMATWIGISFFLLKYPKTPHTF